MGRRPRDNALDVWTSGWHWRERIINFTPSWFTVTMGTGIIIQLLTNFPYPVQWLRNLAYCFWILDIILFSIFTVWTILRCSWYPSLIQSTMEDFSQSNYLGAIPVGFDTIIVGLITFYADRSAGPWVAYGMFWISVFLTLMVSLVAVFVMFVRQPEHKLSTVSGVWLLSFIPLIVTSATGSALLSSLEYPNNILVLVVSFLMWSAGSALCLMVTTIYLWRLMSCNLPPRDAIISCFIPLGPLGQGAFSIQSQANFLASYLRDSVSTGSGADHFQPSSTSGSTTMVLPVLDGQSLLAVAEMINWLGLILGLFMIGLCTFWLAEAIFSIVYRVPHKFNIGWWGFTFPLGTYCNAVVLAGKDMRNEALKGWGATWSIVVILLWCICATGTVYKGFWKGELFHAPGLEGWDYHAGRGAGQAHGSDEKRAEDASGGNSERPTWRKREEYSEDNRRGALSAYEQDEMKQYHPRNTVSGTNGTYTYRKRGGNDDEEAHSEGLV